MALNEDNNKNLNTLLYLHQQSSLIKGTVWVNCLFSFGALSRIFMLIIMIIIGAHFCIHMDRLLPAGPGQGDTAGELHLQGPHH